ncbi:MAG: hypothetical protein HY695_10765 [Deltaproteobacteria bacterium]|nr:hypothetical protein [Deltaproteobacteria bacterium]
MFLRLGKYLVETPDPVNEEERVKANAMIESFVIHLRNLIAFLYSEQVETKDVIGANFFRDPVVWYQRRPPISRLLKKARERSHKEVVHLTTDRIADKVPEKDWPIPALTNEIKRLMRLFVNLASTDRLDPSIKELLNN